MGLLAVRCLGDEGVPGHVLPVLALGARSGRLRLLVILDEQLVLLLSVLVLDVSDDHVDAGHAHTALADGPPLVSLLHIKLRITQVVLMRLARLPQQLPLHRRKALHLLSAVDLRALVERAHRLLHSDVAENVPRRRLIVLLIVRCHSYKLS